jgi:hAT family C-terminal dimerisation region
VLDPRISYEGLMADYAEDADLLADLEKSKSALHTFYHDRYASFTSSADKSDPLITVPVVQNGSPQKVDFTARYKRTNRRVSDELEDYFKLGQEDFDTCRPLDWWWGRRAQFPNLYRLARDILAVPGELFSFFSTVHVSDVTKASY